MIGNIPVLTASGMTLAAMWEDSMLALYKGGCEIPTQYDGEGDRRSKDCTMIMTCLNPLGEPMIHRSFPGGLEALEEYRQEVCDGIKDHWVRDPNDPDDTRWEYTYHERMRKYPVSFRGEVGPPNSFAYDPTTDPYNAGACDQMEVVADQLAKCPYTRRSQIIIWNVDTDIGIADPPCLQSLWFRIVEAEGLWYLNMNVRFRSRDAYDAAFMNAFAFVHLQKKMAGMVAEKAGREVAVGRYCDISDSYHIYGRRLDDFENRFLKMTLKRSWEDRTWTTEFAQPIFDEAKPKIIAKIARVDEERSKQ